MYEYKRIIDLKESTTDSLEQLCNIEAKQGWRVIQISDGNQFRHATLERLVDGTDNKQTNIGSGLQTVSIETATGDERPTTGTRRNKAGTKG